MNKERIKSIATLIVIFIAFLTACKKDGNIADLFLQQTPDELKFSWQGEEKGFAIRTNSGAWKVTATDAPWLTFDVTSGEGNGQRESILAKASINRGVEREGKILIQSGDQKREIMVKQEDGRISLGEASLAVKSFAIKQPIENVFLIFPYQKGTAGEELKFSVDFSGTGAQGLNPIKDYAVTLDGLTGEVKIPISGTPTAEGEIVMTIKLNEIEASTMPNPVTAEVFDPNRPHPDAAAFVISGWLAYPNGSDANHEYIQFLALRDINFSNENFTVITCNNAGQTNGIPPADGWITGAVRTYKFNITSGFIRKGEYFYVGGTSEKINGPNSAAGSIPSNKWVKKHAYNTEPGDDGIGSTTTNLLANSGLTYGVAAFRGTNINHDTEPMDVVFLRNPETSYTLFGMVNGANRGFRVTNTDYYAVTGDIKYINQYNASNVYYNVASVGGAGATASTVGQNNFLELRGEYNVVTAKWSTSRTRNIISLTTSSVISAIETTNSTKMFPAP
ncbi:MAG: BACON domain-containing protein [Sphingobacterium sp.]|jgi:hypothetical protein|nr:BACON domain-containing protein [Sphingobacterium sp.]